jgi:hypothetical protein
MKTAVLKVCGWMVAILLISNVLAFAQGTTDKPVLEGDYDMELNVTGAGAFPIALTVKRDDKGNLTTESKDQIGISITGISIDKDDNVTLNASYQGNNFELKGKRKDDTMGGDFDVSGYQGTWTAKKKKG